MNFKEYFEATLYHGTKAQFDDLKPQRARYGLGVSFTTNPSIALNYAMGKYKGGSKSSEIPNIKKMEYSGNSFNFFEKVPKETIKSVHEQLSPYLKEFTPNKNKLFLSNLYENWSRSGEKFYREIQRAFAKKGTDDECKLAKSKNNPIMVVNGREIEVCSKCSVFSKMPDFLNDILHNAGYDSLCYDDNNDGISHRCYFLFGKNFNNL
jgi:hypothetical protein